MISLNASRAYWTLLLGAGARGRGVGKKGAIIIIENTIAHLCIANATYLNRERRYGVQDTMKLSSSIVTKNSHISA